MPEFEISDVFEYGQEPGEITFPGGMDFLITWASTNQSGYYPGEAIKIHPNGWLEIKEVGYYSPAAIHSIIPKD